jgi:hypothetical protein
LIHRGPRKPKGSLNTREVIVGNVDERLGIVPLGRDGGYEEEGGDGGNHF